MPIKTNPPLVLWRFTDGKPGHEKQTLGLCQALARETSATLHAIPVRRGWKNLAYWLGGHCPYGEGLPPPDLLLGAGHATHLPMLAARRRHGGRIVVLMRPSLPLALFDLCLIPEHDAPPVRGNVVPTQGALNNVRPEGRHDPRRALILIGGPSSHFRWDSEAIARQVGELVQSRPGLHWTLTTSRRTPAGFLGDLGRDDIECLAAENTPAGWLEAELARTGAAWVTPDSVSMVYEALTAGCRVGLFDLPAMADSRVARSILALTSKGTVVGFPPPPAHDSASPTPLNEAGRCARLILEKWFS